MAVNSSTSFVLSTILTILLFSGMQMYRPFLVSSPLTIIFGGYLGSILFLLLVTAIGNLEATLFGNNFQIKLLEISSCLITALIASGMVHRICVTTCFIFSIIGLYYVNRISQKVYATPPSQVAASSVKSRRHK